MIIRPVCLLSPLLCAGHFTVRYNDRSKFLGKEKRFLSIEKMIAQKTISLIASLINVILLDYEWKNMFQMWKTGSYCSFLHRKWYWYGHWSWFWTWWRWRWNLVRRFFYLRWFIYFFFLQLWVSLSEVHLSTISRSRICAVGSMCVRYLWHMLFAHFKFESKQGIFD